MRMQQKWICLLCLLFHGLFIVFIILSIHYACHFFTGYKHISRYLNNPFNVIPPCIRPTMVMILRTIIIIHNDDTTTTTTTTNNNNNNSEWLYSG